MSGRRGIFTEDHEAFRDSVTRFVATEVAPHLDRWRHDGTVPRDVFTAAGDSGYLGTSVPEEFGGGGAEDLGFTAVLIEESASAGAAALSLLFALHSGVALPVLSAGDHTHHLPGLASGELIATVTVPSALSDLSAADGHLSGELASVPGARLADLLLVDLGGADVAVVEVHQSGVTVVPDEPGLAGAEAGAARVVLDEASLQLVKAPSIASSLDLWFAVVALSTARASLQLGIEYVCARKIFGNPLGTFENTRFRMAELSAEIAPATVFVDSCLAAGTAITRSDAAAARLIATRLLDAVVDQCLQFHGGYGYMREYPISTAFADARFLRMAASRFSDPRHALAGQLGL